MSDSSRTVSNPWISRTVHAALVGGLLVVIGWHVYGYFSASETEARVAQELGQSDDIRGLFSVASQAFASAQWGTAAEAFEEIVHQEPGNLPAWVRLAYAQHMLGHYDQALAAYLRVCQFDGRPRQWALYNIAAVYALKKEKRMALDYLQEAVEAGFRQVDTEPPVAADPDFEAMADDSEFLRLAELTKPVSKRNAYRQLDFMIGKWDLTSTRDTRIGFAEFSRASGGYAIVGECVDNTRYTKSTLFMYYEPTATKWQFVWLDDQGHVTQLAGGVSQDESIVLDGEQATADGRRITARATLHELDNGAVHFSFMTSPDGGIRWTDMLDATLVPVESKRARNPATSPPSVE